MGAPHSRTDRQAERHFSGTPITWDYFTAPEGPKKGMIRDISATGLMICSTVEMEARRWLRILLRHPHDNTVLVARARVIRQIPALDSWPDEQITLFRQGIELIDELPQEWLDALIDASLASCSCGSLVKTTKPANPAGIADEICGLCHLKSALI